MDMNISEKERAYLRDIVGPSDVSFDESRLKDVEDSATFSFKKSKNATNDVRKIRVFCRKFRYDILDINESGEDTILIQLSKRSPREIFVTRWLIVLVVTATIFGAVTQGWSESPAFWIMLISFTATIGIFAGTQRLSEYFRDKELDTYEEKQHNQFIKLSSDRQSEMLNAINDQLFSIHDRRFSTLTTIATIAAATLIVATFQTDLTVYLKIFASILMLTVSVSIYAYAIKMEQLIKRAERFFMNIYVVKQVIYRPQYNQLRPLSRSRDSIEKFFTFIDELPTIISIMVAVSILDIIFIMWFLPSSI